MKHDELKKLQPGDHPHALHRFILTVVCALVAMLYSQIAYAYALTSNCMIVSAPTTFTMPVVINTNPNAPVNSLLGSPVSQPYSFNCTTINGFSPGNQAYIQFRLNASIGANATNFPGGGILLPTNLAGVGLLLNASPNALSAGNTTSGVGSDFLIVTTPNTANTGTITAQFVKTGPITPGTISAVSLFHFYWVVLGFNNSTLFPIDTTVSLNGGTVVNVVGCAVNAGSANLTVQLPTVSTTALNGVGKTAGNTPFSLGLVCQAGTVVNITLATASPSGTYTGVVPPMLGSGYATGVGVQLLNGNNTPVTFNALNAVGASPNGALTIPYSAQYFQTAASVTPGNVSATVTFTMSYQ